jgi:integrase
MAYKSAIYSFFKYIYQLEKVGYRITNNEKKILNDLVIRYFSEKRDYTEDIIKFAVANSDKPPKTVKMYIAAIKEFIGYNDVEFTQRQIKQIRLKLPKGSARSIEKDMDTNTVNQILAHFDVKGKALILTLASSGMRIGEALSITFDDVDLKSDPLIISIRQEYTKSAEQRYTFASKEAKNALNEWLKVREAYLQSSQNKNKGLVGIGQAKPKNVNDNRIFPFSDSTVSQMWENALRNANLLSVDKSTNRKQLRIHQLRKYFRSQLALGCPVDIVEALMGHEGYLTDAYRRYTRAQMAEYYKKNEHHITLSQNIPMEEIKKEISAEMNQAIKNLVVENQALGTKNKELEDKLTRLEKVVKVIGRVAMEDPSLLPAMKEFMQA